MNGSSTGPGGWVIGGVLPENVWKTGGKGGSTVSKTGEKASRRRNIGVENRIRNHKILRLFNITATRYSGQALEVGTARKDRYPSRGRLRARLPHQRKGQPNPEIQVWNQRGRVRTVDFCTGGSRGHPDRILEAGRCPAPGPRRSRRQERESR